MTNPIFTGSIEQVKTLFTPALGLTGAALQASRAVGENCLNSINVLFEGGVTPEHRALAIQTAYAQKMSFDAAIVHGWNGKGVVGNA